MAEVKALTKQAETVLPTHSSKVPTGGKPALLDHRNWPNHRLWIVLGLVGIALVSWVFFHLASNVFAQLERERAEGRLSQHQASLEAALNRFNHLPHVLADDDRHRILLSGGQQGNASSASPQEVNRRLYDIATRAGLEAIFIMNASGLTVASSNYQDANGFLGQSYPFRPYFKEAMAGQMGTFFGIGATTKRPGYFISAPVTAQDGRILGAIVVKLSLVALERTWGSGGDSVFVTNRQGIVLLASQQAYRYRTVRVLSEAQLASIRMDKQFAGLALEPFKRATGPEFYLPESAELTLHLRKALSNHGWTLHSLANLQPARTRALLALVVLLGLLTLGLLITQTLRADRVRKALGLSRAAEQELRIVNERLANEIEDRKATERALRQTQDELRRASRLAALGQMSASVSHELSQPISAMRNHLAAMALQVGSVSNPTTGDIRKENPNTTEHRLTHRLNGLVDRMEGIVRQLKFFGKPGDGMMSAVGLQQALEECVLLVEANIQRSRATLHLELPDEPIVVRGNKLRLEQVLTNLLRNALDSMEETEKPITGHSLSIAISTLETKTGTMATIVIKDTGHGLGDRTLDELSEPFMTTRASGRGLGLGLAISREIILEHKGTLHAGDRTDGHRGAMMTVKLPCMAHSVSPTDRMHREKAKRRW